ncbi:MAG: IS4 family transposase [Chitinophagaceae bacterium]
MTINNHPQLRKILSILDIESLARQTSFTCRRSRKITPEDFLISFFQMIINRKFSLRSWAENLSILSGSLVSFQAVAKKLDYRQEPFFRALLQKALMLKLQQRLHFKIHTILHSFNRVILEDSTCFKLPKSLFDFFPGAQLPHGRKAGGRVQFRIDLKSHTYESMSLQSYCANDQRFAANILESIQEDDLIIRDLGYWNIPAFKHIMQFKAYFVSRLRLNINVLLPETQRNIDLYAFLKKKEKQGVNQIDMPVLLSEKYQLPVRLIAIKLQPEQAAKRRRAAKENRHKDTPISNESYYLMSWNLLITNVKQDIWDTHCVYHAYSLRWHIEMIFKCWKSKFNFEAIFKNCNGKNPMKPEIILLLTITTYLFLFISGFNKAANLVWEKYKRILSPQKFADILLADTIITWKKPSPAYLSFLAYYCCYDRRKDRLNHFEKTYMILLS